MAVLDEVKQLKNQGFNERLNPIILVKTFQRVGSYQPTTVAGKWFEFIGSRTDRFYIQVSQAGIIGRNKIEESDFKEIKDKIKIVSTGIREQNFQATPTYMACTYCAYNQICPFAIIR